MQKGQTRLSLNQLLRNPSPSKRRPVAQGGPSGCVVYSPRACQVDAVAVERKEVAHSQAGNYSTHGRCCAPPPLRRLHHNGSPEFVHLLFGPCTMVLLCWSCKVPVPPRCHIHGMAQLVIELGIFNWERQGIPSGRAR